ncbi:MAG: PAS domain S-box protein [Candidatus Bathyarchaeota archaeon]|nr:PAS domain S-box protein [Candidatus Bathyarchaeota archaeon]
MTKKLNATKEFAEFLTSEQGFRSLCENAAVAVAITDTKGRFKYVNKAMVDLLGYSVEELFGRPFKFFLHPEDRAKITRLFLRIVVLRRQPRDLEFRALRKDGSTLYLWSKPTRFMINGKTVGFQAIMVDVTKLKEVEKKLMETNRRLETIFETASEGMMTVDENENITFVNRAFAEMLGYHAHELIGVNLRKFVDEESFQKIRRQTEIRKRGETSRYEITLYHKDGKPRILQVSASPLWDEKGEYEGAISIIMDVTERRKMEEKLKESEERLKRLIEYAPDAIYVNDLQGRFIDGNKQAEALIGYKKEELIGKSIFEAGIFPKKCLPKIKEAIERNLKGEKYGPEEFELIRKDGKTVFVEISAFPIVSGGKIEVIGIARDITERKQMQQKLEEYAQHLEELVEQRTKALKETREQLIKSERLAAIGQVAAMVGHDLRNPLTGIKGAVYYLKNKLGPSVDKNVSGMLRLIEENVEYANKIISDLMEYSREIKLELNETTPKAIVTETLSTMEIPEGIQFLDLTQDNPKIKVDIDKMKRVLGNIIRNAVDAMPKGGKITITSKESNGNLEIAFTDTGTGIPKDVLEKIWMPFFTTKSKGMGLGLPICKRLVEAHGGKISIENKVGEGTTVTVTISIKSKIFEGGEKIWLEAPESLSSTMTKA